MFICVLWKELTYCKISLFIGYVPEISDKLSDWIQILGAAAT